MNSNLNHPLFRQDSVISNSVPGQNKETNINSKGPVPQPVADSGRRDETQTTRYTIPMGGGSHGSLFQK